MTTYYSDFTSTLATPGKSLSDFGNTTFNAIIENSNDYVSTGSYTVGTTVINQGVVWRCATANFSPSNIHAPPTLPVVFNTWWEYVGSQGNFTWIVYGDSVDNGVTITNISTTSAGTRQWLGVAYNKSNTNETTVQADYTWSKIVGADGIAGTRGSKAFYASGTSWTDAAADAAITTAGFTKVTLDVVTISSSAAGFAATKYWNGTTWTVVAQVIDGNLLVLGSVTATKLVLDGVTLSADVSGSLKISNSGVNTVQIANNAVTDISSSFTAATVPIISSSYDTIQTATIITSTATDKVDIISNFNANFISGSNTVLNLRIKRGSTVIYTSYTWTPQYVSPAFFDTPGAAGTYTYTLEVANVGAIQQVDCSNRYLRLIRITK